MNGPQTLALGWGVCMWVSVAICLSVVSIDRISIQNKGSLPSVGCLKGRTSIFVQSLIKLGIKQEHARVVLYRLNMSHREMSEAVGNAQALCFANKYSKAAVGTFQIKE